jgi:hypothetical protein
MATQLCDILYSNSQDMLVLSSTILSPCYDCCTDGSTSPGNYGYHLVGIDYINFRSVFSCCTVSYFSNNNLLQLKLLLFIHVSAIYFSIQLGDTFLSNYVEHYYMLYYN